jgi:hypothetical protein
MIAEPYTYVTYTLFVLLAYVTYKSQYKQGHVNFIFIY